MHENRLALTVREAAALLGVSKDTIYQMVYAHRIPFKRLRTARGRGSNGKIIIPRAALERWLNEPEEAWRPKLVSKR